MNFTDRYRSSVGGGLLLLAFLGGCFCRALAGDSQPTDRPLQAIEARLLSAYVRFVQSEYALSPDLGPCETLSRAEIMAFARQRTWAERTPGAEKGNP